MYGQWTEDLPQRGLYALSPMTISIMGKTSVGITPPNPDKADFKLDPDRYRFKLSKEKPEFDLNCKNSVETFPNACNGYVIAQGKNNNGGWRDRNFQVALFVCSNYTDGKTREIVHAKFKYRDRKDEWQECDAETKFLSGECFGMSTTREPRVPEDPPVLEGWTPMKVVPAPATTTPEPTPAPAPTPPAPTHSGGGGAWTVILILVILGLIGGAAAFFLRRQRLMQEEQSLRNAREVELN